MNCHQFRKIPARLCRRPDRRQVELRLAGPSQDVPRVQPHCRSTQRPEVAHRRVGSAYCHSGRSRIANPVRHRTNEEIAEARASLTGPFADRPLLRVLAMAACVVITVLSLWATGIVGPGDSLRDSLAASADFDIDSAELKMRGVVVRHNKCVESCNQQAHQLAGLPSDRESAALELASRLGDQVAIAAPDLTGFGYEFESAAVCSPDREVHGAAALYTMYVSHAYGTRLSFFSVPHWKGADGLLADATLRNPFAFTPLGNCQNQSIVAWNGKATTYIVCAPINQEDLSKWCENWHSRFPPTPSAMNEPATIADSCGQDARTPPNSIPYESAWHEINLLK